MKYNSTINFVKENAANFFSQVNVNLYHFDSNYLHLNLERLYPYTEEMTEITKSDYKLNNYLKRVSELGGREREFNRAIFLINRRAIPPQFGES